MTRRRTPQSPPALKSALPLKAEEASDDTKLLARFARDIGAGTLDDPLGVLWWVAWSIEHGYIPPDDLLRWLADRFARYLDEGPKSPRLDVVLGLVPAKRPRGKAGHDIRELDAERERTDGYVARLATLDSAGFKSELAAGYLNDGVPKILPPYKPKGGQLSLETLEKYAPEWRGRDEYIQCRRIAQDSERRGSRRIAELRAYVKKHNLD